jgi:hypothetical protein
MTLPYYRIWTQASGQAPLYLTEINGIGLAVQSGSMGDFQLWCAVEQFVPPQGAPGLLIINKQSSLAIDAATDNAVVTLTHPEKVQRGTWNLAGNSDVFQLAASTGQNLCVDGGGTVGDGTRVFTWNWGDGGSRYLWNFTFAEFS